MVELLRRRNKPSQPCSAEWKELDDWILMQQIKDIGCRAPYTKTYEKSPVCETQVKMKQSIVKWPDATYKYPTPCEGASNIGYKFYNVPFPEHNWLTNCPYGVIHVSLEALHSHAVYPESLKKHLKQFMTANHFQIRFRNLDPCVIPFQLDFSAKNSQEVDGLQRRRCL